jgi:hypothetical protein
MNGDIEVEDQPPMQGIAPQAQPDPMLPWRLAEQEPPSAPGEQDLADFRAQHAAELEDPRVLGEFFNLTRNEVGGQGPEARQAFMETVLNRAQARGQTLSQAINDRRYYPSVSYRPSSMSAEKVADYSGTLQDVIGGSNISNYATGNASGRVGFNGGPHTFSAGGERFGIEGPDRGWHQSSGGGGRMAELTPSQDLEKNQQAAMMAASYTGKPLEQVDTSDLNAILQGQIEGRSRGLLAGEEPTTASLQEFNRLQSQVGAGGDQGEVPATASLPGWETGDMPSPDTSQMTAKVRPDGTVVFGEGTDQEVIYNPVTQIKQWRMRDIGRTFQQIGPYGPTQSFKTHDFHVDPTTGFTYDYNAIDENGRPKRIDIEGQQAKVDPGIWKAIIDARAPIGVRMPDGSMRPFANNAEAMKTLQEHETANDIPTKWQQQLIMRDKQSLASGRNPKTRQYLAIQPQYGSAMDNLSIPYDRRNGISDSLLISLLQGIEQPGYKPNEIDTRNLLHSFGLVGQFEVKGTQLKALTQFLGNKIDEAMGKPSSYDKETIANLQGRMIPQEVLPQMEQALTRLVRPRWEQYNNYQKSLENELRAAGVRHPEIHFDDARPQFIKDEEDAAAQATGRAPSVPGAATPQHTPPPPSNDQAFPLIQKALNSSDPNMRALGQQAMEEYKRRTQATPTPSPTP